MIQVLDPASSTPLPLMTLITLLRKSLLFYWRSNVAIVLGVIVATAVLGGALIVGDSVRDSLRQMSLERLGAIDHALTGQRYFREALADVPLSVGQQVSTAPMLIMQGTLERPLDEGRVSNEQDIRTSSSNVRPRDLRAGHVQVYGLDERAWGMLEHGDVAVPADGSIVLSRRAADQLQAQPGDMVSLIVEIPASIPRDALLGDREQTVTALDLTISGIAEDVSGLARLGFNPTQQLPLNAFVSLDQLQQQTGLAAVSRSRRNPIAKPARVNTLLMAVGPQVDAHSAHGNASADRRAALSDETAGQLTQQLRKGVTLDDLALRLVRNEEHGYVSLESEQMFLENDLGATALEVAGEVGGDVSPVLVYLLNEMWNTADPEKYSMYSVIAGIKQKSSPPFGPFELAEGARIDPRSVNGPDFADQAALERLDLSGDRVLVNEWLAKDLDVHPGDKIGVKYYVVGDRGELPEKEHQFEVAGVVNISGPADDGGYTPDVPGVTDADTYADWREPFPLKRERITARDDEYWELYRTTPKLFTSLETAQSLWQSRYGKLTSIRIAPRQGQTLDQLASEFEQEFLAELTPLQAQLVVQPVKLQGLQAASGTTNFAGLFIGFSFFLIAAAAILIALLFRLAIELRGTEMGLLSAVGFGIRRTRRLLLLEGSVLALVGGALGLATAVGYAALMMYGLKTWWYGAIGTRFLFLSVQPTALIYGFCLALIVALGAVWWGVRHLSKLPTRELLAGATGTEEEPKKEGSNWKRHLAIASLIPSVSRSFIPAIVLCVGLLLLVLTLTGIIPDAEAFGGFSWRVVMFFVVGVTMLVGGLTGLSVLLAADTALAVTGGGFVSRLRLSLRNASRHQSRSVMTTSLIASATFVLVAVAAGQMDPAELAPNPHSGNGGFTLVAETDVPILYDVNTPAGRAKLGFDPTDQPSEQLMSRVRVMPFLVKPGENASCLNLYQTQLPTILGIPDDVLQTMIDEDRFAFADTPGEHPWSLLKESLPDRRIPVFGDMNTLMYSLHKPIGDMIDVPGAEGPGDQLQVVGMFAGSVFQGVLVMAESNFRKLFPDVAGFSYFLIETETNQIDDVAQLLESRLGDYGFDAEPVAERIADFLAVQNTYLSTFQTLGGLGLLLGTVGLAVVMLRNVIERRGELALLRAVGFQPRDVALLVLFENGLLMLWGLGCGAISALLAMLPHLLSTGAEVPWGSLWGLLTAIFVFGMLAATVAVNRAVHVPILSTLQGE